MAYEFYLKVEGSKQGKFKGDGISSKHKDEISGLKFHYEVMSPRDAATGQASGKRQHKPIMVTTEWGAFSPQLFQALTTNETLKKVDISFYKTNKMGEEQVYSTMKLTNANVTGAKFYGGIEDGADGSSAKHASVGGGHELTEWSFTFQKIEFEAEKSMAVDDWYAAKA
jgi:type VI secretion system secreted protein Hcp